MEYIHHRNNKCQKNLEEIVNRVINCIHSKIEMTISISNRKCTDFTYYAVNTHGSPILSSEHNNKIKQMVFETLVSEGFQVKYKTDIINGIQWAIIISW